MAVLINMSYPFSISGPCPQAHQPTLSKVHEMSLNNINVRNIKKAHFSAQSNFSSRTQKALKRFWTRSATPKRGLTPSRPVQRRTQLHSPMSKDRNLVIRSESLLLVRETQAHLQSDPLRSRETHRTAALLSPICCPSCGPLRVWNSLPMLLKEVYCLPEPTLIRIPRLNLNSLRPTHPRPSRICAPSHFNRPYRIYLG
jgi:hypothetical protein